MSDMNFGVNLLPTTDSTYTLGTDEKRWIIYGDVQPKLSQSYDAYTISANNQNYGDLYFLKVNITDTSNWYAPWWVKYVITVTTTNNYVQGHYEVRLGAAGSMIAYHIFNDFYSTSYYPIYYHTLLRPNSGYSAQGAYLGAAIRSAYNNTSLARTISVDVIDYYGCTVEFLDSLTTHYSLYNSTYYTANTYNATSIGLQEYGDANDWAYSLGMTYPRFNTGSIGIGRYTFFMEASDGTYQSITSTFNSTATTHIINSNKFYLEKIFYRNNSADLAASNSSDTTNSWVNEQYTLVDCRYSMNCAQTLTARAPLYLVGTVDTDGFFTLADITTDSIARWYTQDPVNVTNCEDYVFIYLGVVYNDTAPYRVAFEAYNPAYQVINGVLHLYNAASYVSTTEDATNTLYPIGVESGTTNLSKRNTSITMTGGALTASTFNGYTLAAASAKNIDTSITSSSTSTNLPTSAAVANFVEGKGYITSYTNYYHGTGSWSDLTYTATAYNSAPGLAFTIPSASTSQAGAVQLTNSVSSTSTTTAATPYAVKLAYELANSKTDNTGTVTSVTIAAGLGISVDSSSAITTSGTRTITNSGVREVYTGTSNGTITVNTGGTTSSIAVYGLGSAAYTASTAYATAAQGTLASNAMPKSGGTFTGAVTLAADPTSSLQPATKNYVDNYVSVSGTLATGTEVGTITVGDTTTTLYAPAASAQTIAVTQASTDPTIEFIIGTNTESSASLTGVLSTTTAIADGKIIFYYNPYVLPATTQTLTLTYASSGTTTGAIPIYTCGEVRATTPYPASSIIVLIYYNSKFYIVNNNVAVLAGSAVASAYANGDEVSY